MIVGAQQLISGEDSAGKCVQFGVGQMFGHALPFREGETGVRLALAGRPPVEEFWSPASRFVSRLRAAMRRLMTCCRVHSSRSPMFASSNGISRQSAANAVS